MAVNLRRHGIMVQLSPSERCRVVLEYERLGSKKAVAKHLGINVKTVRRWVGKHEKDKSLESKSGKGRKPVMDQDTAAEAFELLLSGDFNGAKQVGEKLSRDGKVAGNTPPHATTVIRHARAAAAAKGETLKADRGRPSKQLLERTRQQRIAFCKANKGRAWKHVMFTDRKRFMFKHPGTRVRRVQWVRGGERRAAFTPNRPMCLNVYAGLTPQGVTKVHMVAGTSGETSKFKNQKGQASKNITIVEYNQVLIKTLLPEGKRSFANKGLSGFVLQQDNDPTHKKGSQRALKEWAQKFPGCTINVLQRWPPHSPDLSLIENIWGYVQQQVDAAGCKTFQEFKSCVKRELAAVPKSMITNLYNSMPTRISLCLEKGGDRISY